MNDNNIQITNTPDLNNQAEEAVNKKFFDETLGSHLSEETVKKLKLSNKWKDDTLEPVKTATDQEKINAYDDLNVKALPKDWEAQLIRKNELENKLADFIQISEELKGWTDAFLIKKPQEVELEIKKLEEKNTKTETELESWQNTFGGLTPNQVKEKELELWKNNNELTLKKEEVEQELSQWTSTWNGKDLEKVKKEWELLNKRPHLPFSEEKFWDDYAQRKTVQQSKLEEEEREKQKAEVERYKEKSRKMWFAINNYLKAERIRRYASAEPVKDIKQAQKAIANLLEETEKNLKDYLEGGDKSIIEKHPILGLSCWEKEKEDWACQVLEWIEEARKTLDYEKLFERWNRGKKEYDEKDENDLDGSLYLLSKRLEVKNF